VTDDTAVEFLLTFARVGHDAGYPTADLEERLLALADAAGLESAQISSTPTIIEISLGALPLQRTYAIRVRPRVVDLDAIARLDAVVRDVLDGRGTIVDALAAVAAVDARPLRRRWYVLLPAYGLAGAAVTPVLGGSWREVLAGALVGVLVGAVSLLSRRVAGAEPMIAPLAAVVASFGAALFARLGLDASTDIVTLAALVTFLPGMALTIGVQELATQHLQSGVANTANALVQLLGLVVGVTVGRSVAKSWFGVSPHVVAQSGFSVTHVVGAVAAGFAFTVTLRAPARAAPIMCTATVLAIVTYAIGRHLLGAPAGVFVAALAIGVCGGFAGGYTRRSPLVFVVPGVLMLVPGSAGFNSILQLLTGQTVSGINAGFDTLVTAGVDRVRPHGRGGRAASAVRRPDTAPKLTSATPTPRSAPPKTSDSQCTCR
jgi:uncharacterized membrane protein YjjP (DUF1212 family)